MMIMMNETQFVMGAIICNTCENCYKNTCDMYMETTYDAIAACKENKFKYYMRKEITMAKKKYANSLPWNESIENLMKQFHVNELTIENIITEVKANAKEKDNDAILYERAYRKFLCAI